MHIVLAGMYGKEENMSITGRLTLPTDVDMVDETIRLKNLLGADALRDCDGTTMPDELLSQDGKKYATYYTTRKDNEWANANPDEIQQEYLISEVGCHRLYLSIINWDRIVIKDWDKHHRKEGEIMPDWRS